MQSMRSTNTGTWYLIDEEVSTDETSVGSTSLGGADNGEKEINGEDDKILENGEGQLMDQLFEEVQDGRFDI